MESFELTLLVYVFSSFAILILLVTSNAFENVIETTLMCRWAFDCSTNFKKEFKMYAEVSRVVFKICGLKTKLWPKIKILVKNRNSGRKLKFWSKIKILLIFVKNLIFGQNCYFGKKSKF